MRVALAVLAGTAVVAAAAGAAPRVVTRIGTGQAPCGIAAGFGSVWVAVYETGKLVRIDPATNRATKRITVARGICPLAATSGAVWVASDRTNVLYRVDPARNRVVARIPVPRWPAHLLAALGGVWVSGYESGVVARIDPRTNSIARVYEVGGNPSGLAALDGSLYVAFARGGTSLGRLDLTSGAVTQIGVGHTAPGFLTVAAGSLWTTTEDGYALRVDPAGPTIRAFPVPGTPAEARLGRDGTIWVAEKQHNTLTRIDPRANRIVDVTGAGPGALAVVAAGGDMWVTSFAGSDVWRFRAAR
jgi:streptogramin lyase